jgi:hypothetical protein
MLFVRSKRTKLSANIQEVTRHGETFYRLTICNWRRQVLSREGCDSKQQAIRYASHALGLEPTARAQL